MTIKRICVKIFLQFVVLFTLYGCDAGSAFNDNKGDIVSIQISPVRTTFGSNGVQIAQGNKLSLIAYRL